LVVEPALLVARTRTVCWPTDNLGVTNIREAPHAVLNDPLSMAQANETVPSLGLAWGVERENFSMVDEVEASGSPLTKSTRGAVPDGQAETVAEVVAEILAV
jgi:hypothetical protein